MENIIENNSIIDDTFIINHFLKSNGSVNPYYKKFPEVLKYLETRYNDIPEEMFTYIEVIRRIQLGIEHRPVCLICGKPLKFNCNIKTPYNKACSKECANKIHG